MATIARNLDGTLTVTLDAVESDTYTWAEANGVSLEQYVTLWLGDRTKEVFNAKFQQLAPEQKASILEAFRAVQPEVKPGEDLRT